MAGVVGLGRAAELARADLDHEPARLAALRDRLESRLLAIPDARVNGGGARVPNTTKMSFGTVDAVPLLMALDLAGVAVSTGAACAAGAAEPSHVRLAMGLSPDHVQASLRFSLGRGTTEEEIDRAALVVGQAIERLQNRALHSGTAALPVWRPYRVILRWPRRWEEALVQDYSVQAQLVLLRLLPVVG